MPLAPSEPGHADGLSLLLGVRWAPLGRRRSSMRLAGGRVKEREFSKLTSRQRRLLALARCGLPLGWGAAGRDNRGPCELTTAASPTVRARSSAVIQRVAHFPIASSVSCRARPLGVSSYPPRIGDS